MWMILVMACEDEGVKRYEDMSFGITCEYSSVKLWYEKYECNALEWNMWTKSSCMENVSVKLWNVKLWNGKCEGWSFGMKYVSVKLWYGGYGSGISWHGGQGWPLYLTKHHVLLSDCKSSQGLRGDSHEVLRKFAGLLFWQSLASCVHYCCLWNILAIVVPEELSNPKD